MEFKGCEISNTRGISDLRGILKRLGILNIVKFKCLGISNARKISRPCARVFAERRNCG
ncbi:hypothetical protein [uncultured Campylobacter sp.]|uniref:hypothetical protein n=1 Tax=uncultured Campylobacter sp. TaxID=218934 RepID=UPI0026134CA3|nr:hypothetical protein [uncultured Campylobacter sp.]